MAYNRTAAKKLLNASELALFDSGRRDALCDLDERALKGKIDRTRRLRDKYRDLVRRQRLATRGRTGTKRGPTGDANFRTAEKDVLFTELLGRFEARQAKLQDTAKRKAPAKQNAPAKQKATAPRAPAGKPAKKAPPTRAPRGEDERSAKAPATPVAGGARNAQRDTGFMSSRAKGMDTERQRHKSRGTAIQAHLRSQGRRSQAKRDSR